MINKHKCDVSFTNFHMLFLRNPQVILLMQKWYNYDLRTEFETDEDLRREFWLLADQALIELSWHTECNPTLKTITKEQLH